MLLQITAMCAILSHDLIKNEKLGLDTLEVMIIVFIGGYLMYLEALIVSICGMIEILIQ